MDDVKQAVQELKQAIKETNEILMRNTLQLERNNVTLEEHMRRTELAEKGINILKAEVHTVKDHVILVNGIFKAALFIAGMIVGAIQLGVLKLPF